MAIQDDFTVDYIDKKVTHIAGTTVYTVNQLYSYLQDLFDDLTQMDDDTPMSAQTPTEYTMVNGWFIDDTSVQYLRNGAIQTNGYTGEIQVLTLSATGYTNCVAGDIGKEVTDDAAGVGNLLAYNNTTRKWWIRTTSTIGDTSTMAITGGTGAGTADGASLSGEDLYANIYTLGTIESSPAPQVYVFQDGEAIAEWDSLTNWDRGHIDVLVKVKEAGVEIAEGVITVFARQFGDSYDNFEIDLTTGGRNAVPLATATDLDNTSPEAYLLYDNETTAPSVGDIIEGETSLASAEVVSITDWGSEGVLGLGHIKGIFQDNENLQVSAVTMVVANGTIGDTYIAYDNESGSGFTVGESVNVSAGAEGALRGLQDDGLTGKMVIESTNYTDYADDNAFQGGSSSTTADVNGAGTRIVSGFDDIKVYHVNYSLDYDGGAVAFSVEDFIEGSLPMLGAVADDGAVLTDETTAANQGTADDMTLLPAVPAQEDAYYFGGYEKFDRLEIDATTQGSGSWTIVWEYYDGSAWQALSNVTDGTSGFTAAVGTQFVTFDVPTDWAQTAVDSITAWWIRARVSAYTSVTTQPLAGQAWTYGEDCPTAYVLATGATASGTLTLGNWNGTFFQDNAKLIVGATENALCNGGGYPITTMNKAFSLQSAYPYSVVCRIASRRLTDMYEYFKYICDEDSTYSMYKIQKDLDQLAFADDGGVFTDESVEALDSTTDDMTLLPATPAQEDAYYWGNVDNKFGKIRINSSQQGSGSWTIVWEYYDGSTWVNLATSHNLSDGTSGFTAATGWQEVTFDAPLDWGTTAVDGTTAYWVRARVSAYTSVTTQPLATESEMFTSITPEDGEEYITAGFGYAVKKAAPLGTFAGGTFFGAQGVWLDTDTVHSSDVKSYQLIDANGTTRNPPNQQTLKVTDVASGDRVSVFRTSGGDILKTQYTSHASSNAAGDSDFVVQEAIANDTPTSGVLRIVDNTNNVEHRLRYASWATSTFTFNTEITASCDAGGSSTVLVDADGGFDVADVEVGDLIVNVTDSSWAHVTAIAAGQLTTTPLQGGAGNDWGTGDTYSIHTLPETYDGSDTAYVPFIDAEATGTEIEVVVTYVSVRNILIRVRKKGIIPFEIASTFESTGRTAAAIRTNDTIVV